ncbi:MAG TPA: DUF4124 domain-containing protein [Steroidobacteraceae bacterium]
MRILLILAGLALSLAAASQEIYRWVDKDGIVHYSDQPGSPNAELITVIEPNAYEGEAATPDGGASGSSGAEPDEEPSISPYESLSIVQPAPDQVFFGSDATISVQADLQGTLRPDHSVVFFLNGNRRPAAGLGMELTGLTRGTYFLRASILDQRGQPVLTSEQTTFHVRQASVQNPQTPVPPRPRPRPTPKPAPSN